METVWRLCWRHNSFFWQEGAETRSCHGAVSAESQKCHMTVLPVSRPVGPCSHIITSSICQKNCESPVSRNIQKPNKILLLGHNETWTLFLLVLWEKKCVVEKSPSFSHSQSVSNITHRLCYNCISRLHQVFMRTLCKRLLVWAWR